ncbi:guanine nucleotide exchange factor in mesoderm isoform X2 [Haematobia irritans]|uniref:guanine nucleotide exchange factor in mesoderm isoform X2 n=1 Tax=Haematobia irritans TaxID=7368 RepID=UPI003F4FB630
MEGSSTDLTPSLLGIYDTLTTSLDGGSASIKHSTPIKSIANSDCDNRNITKLSKIENLQAPSQTESYLSKLQSYAKRVELKTSLAETDNLSQISHSHSTSGGSSSSNSIRGSLESVASSTGGTLSKHRSNIRVLSPNVQRIINHSDAEAVDAVDIEALQSTPKTDPNAPHSRLYKKTSIPHSSTHKLKFSHLPLSKTTGKLTQTGTDLVETFNVALKEDSRRNEEKSNGLRKPPTPAVYPIPGVDNDKTPTNAAAFNFDTNNSDRLQGNRILSLPQRNYLEDCLANEESTLDEIVSNMSLEYITADEDSAEPINADVVAENQKNLNIDGSTSAVNSEDRQFVDAINAPLISKYATRTATTRPLTYARSKSLAARDFAQKNIEVKKTASTYSRSMLLPELETEDNQFSAESLDRLTDIKPKFSPKESRKVHGLLLPEIVKLKHRPLSSSSICSTSSSSSSSSGAEHMNSKMQTSYLASVESLDDHSENELVDVHAGMSVFERACMEIVDSERNYVNDLGEVLNGYLLDWKERACLRQDDLQVLFSNIEDVYHFNQHLLKHLSDAILNPVKIAKCFIDLKDGFEVYTTYCTSYPEAISLLTKLLQATHTNALLASTQRMLHHTLPLGSYLLKPVQRILKYHLLLDNLRKHCDIKEVMQAYEIMRQVARNIDQVKRKLEQQTRVKELCGILDGWLGPELTVLGELRLEGVLMENNKPRKVLLFATMLIIAKAKEDSRLQFKSYIHQNNLMLNEHLAGEPTSFYVIPYDEPRNQIKLTAKNRDQKRLWTQHIKSVILEKFDNIPLRAKELVYQLGDEEDRSTDKSPWKWGLHTTTKPIYLERRNQFRHSEMRNRSKVKRKTITNGSSIEVFNETANKEAHNLVKLISKSAESINDQSTGIEEGEDVVVLLREEKCENGKCQKGDKCTCPQINTKEGETRSKSVRQISKSFRFGSGKPLKERSKSVPRISLPFGTLDKIAQDDANEKISNYPADSEPLNSKTLPKRMSSTLKKQKSKSKETSTFYMALNEFEGSSNTVLKITESSENILSQSKYEEDEISKDPSDKQQLPDVIQRTEDATNGERERPHTLAVTSSEKAKPDAQIVLDLLKNSKEFDKHCSKLQKKRSFDKNMTSPKITETKWPKEGMLEMPPRPPSRSPPPLDTDQLECIELKTHDGQPQEEPIYETLLRNVHAPYKFSPILTRSKSGQYNGNNNQSKESPKKSPPPRPESDYVTLVYSADGVLKQVDDEDVPRSPKKDQDSSVATSPSSSSSSTVTLKRESMDSQNPPDHHHLVLDMPQQMSASFHGMSDLNQIRSHNPKSILKRLWSHSSLTVQEQQSTQSQGSLCRSINNLERRGSSDFEKERHSVLHLQGSETIGERMAHVDYADPRTLFSVCKYDQNKQVQRDSVFSLTSSNDSVCDSNPVNQKHTTRKESFAYEDSLEACLENDFRDSAVYSDDNDRRNDYSLTLSLRSSQNPPLMPKPVIVPPSPLDKVPLKRSTSSNKDLPQSPAASRAPGVIMCPPHMSSSSAQSWVLQQINNFGKKMQESSLIE